jgi:hypothetical protein
MDCKIINFTFARTKYPYFKVDEENNNFSKKIFITDRI